MQTADPNQRFVSGFLDYLKVEKGLAALSVSAYRSDLAVREFVGKRKRTVRGKRAGRMCAAANALFANRSMPAA